MSGTISVNGITLWDGCTIKLHRFDNVYWVVHYGWYNFDGSRRLFGWFMINKDNLEETRPLCYNDFYDIYLVQQA